MFRTALLSLALVSAAACATSRPDTAPTPTPAASVVTVENRAGCAVVVAILQDETRLRAVRVEAFSNESVRVVPVSSTPTFRYVVAPRSSGCTFDAYEVAGDHLAKRAIALDIRPTPALTTAR